MLHTDASLGEGVITYTFTLVHASIMFATAATLGHQAI